MSIKNIKVTIVISMFNEKISNHLLIGAIGEFEKLGGDKNNIEVYKVPGAFEIPGTVMQLLKNHQNIHAILTLGSIIKGETAHFEHISSSVTDALSKISIAEDTNIPIIYGILTTYNYQQAISRSDLRMQNKGAEVMRSTIDTIGTYNKIKR
jgi:6,7-dimethyl-8-ribityllumazine synthase